MASGERFQPFNVPGGRQVSLRTRIENIRSMLWNEKMLNEAHWRELNDYVSPRKARWFTSDRNKGDRRNQKIIDSTATFSLRTTQSGMHAGMTNPARPWVKLLTPDPELNEYGAVKEWLHVVTQRMLTLFSQTNLYNALPTHYGCKALFGTAATGMIEDGRDTFRCYSYPIGSYAIANDVRGRVNQWVYECEKTVLEIVETYLVDRETNMIDWQNASNTIRSLWDQGSFNQMVKLCWVVVPNADYDPRKLLDPVKGKAFSSFHFEVGQEREDVFLRRHGYNEFPILVSRWDVTGDDWWGTDCPGMVCLGDVKQLQTGERRSAQAVEKMLNPPLQAPTQVRNQKASLLPGDVTYVDAREGNGVRPIHEVNFAIDKLEMKQEQCRFRIRRSFYEDLFLMLAHAEDYQKTATEILERKEEKLIALGPVLERSKDELHDPMIDRAYAMMERAGMIPEPPQELIEMRLKVEYTSMLAQAQKLVGVAGHERFMNGASNLMAAFPQVKHKINVFQAIDDYNEMLGNNPKIVYSDEVAMESAQREAQAAQQQAMMENARNISGAVKDLGTTTTDGNSVLAALAGAAQQAVPA